MALAPAGNKTLLLLLLLLFSVTCSYGNQNQQFFNSCGDINISFPFNLQGDPSYTCNDNDYTLVCDENNRTVLNLPSGKYYVQSINYAGYSIRLVDVVGIQTKDICSPSHLLSSTFLDFTNGGTVERPLYTYAAESGVVFLRCENPVHSPIYINTTGYCNSTRGDQGNYGYYSYAVAARDVSVMDVPVSCLLESFYLSSSQLIRRMGSNLSSRDFIKALEYGFEVYWRRSIINCDDCRKRADCFRDSVTAICNNCRTYGNCIRLLNFEKTFCTKNNAVKLVVLQTVIFGVDDGPGTLREGCRKKEPLWIVFEVSGTIHLSSYLNVSSYKTIDGRGHIVKLTGKGLRLKECEHIIICNLQFEGGRGHDVDGIQIKPNSRHIWIDRCSLRDYDDGLIDITRQSTDITVSRCHFAQHDKTMLIGADPSHVGDRCIRVTIHHCFFDGTRQRHPRLRFGKVHLYNNYTRNWGIYAVCASVESQIYSQCNIYEAGQKKKTFEYYTEKAADKEEAKSGLIRSEGDLFLKGAQACLLTGAGNECMFHPTEFYPTWTMETASDSLKAVLQVCSGWQSLARPKEQGVVA